MKSFRQSLNQAYPYADFAKGIRNQLVSHHNPVEGQTFPFPTAKQIMTAAEWPTSYEYLGNYPNNRELSWSNEAQGVTHNDSFWFITQNNALWKFPVGWNLNKDIPNTQKGKQVAQIQKRKIPSELAELGYNHFGDLDCFDGLLFVPMEGPGKKPPPIVALFSAEDLAFLGYSFLSLQSRDGPWCAVHPHNRVLYSSRFGPLTAKQLYDPNGQPSGLEWHGNYVLELDTYKWSFKSGVFELEPVGRVPLYHPGAEKKCGVLRIQGGTFTPNGQLYLSSDVAAKCQDGPGCLSGIPVGESALLSPKEFQPADGGILGFDPLTGEWKRHIHVKFSKFDIIGNHEELEGLTVWNLPPESAPGIEGDIHLLMIDNFGSWLGDDDDDVYFKHFSSIYQKTN